MDFLAEMSTASLFMALVGLTNILTEVTKRIAPLKKAEYAVVFWAVCLSVAVTLLQFNGEGCEKWVLEVLEGVIEGGLVAYAAMFGYDALYERLPEALRTMVRYLNGGDEDRA